MSKTFDFNRNADQYCVNLGAYLKAYPCPEKCNLEDYICGQCDEYNEEVCSKCDKIRFFKSKSFFEETHPYKEKELTHITVTSVLHIEHIVPNMSCGTGYSEPDKFEISINCNGHLKIHKIWIDIWYRPDIHEAFLDDVKRFEKDNRYIIDNMDEFYELYNKALQCKK